MFCSYQEAQISQEAESFYRTDEILPGILEKKKEVKIFRNFLAEHI